LRTLSEFLGFGLGGFKTLKKRFVQWGQGEKKKKKNVLAVALQKEGQNRKERRVKMGKDIHTIFSNLDLDHTII